jgi:uncharacterized protein (TIGR02246 family)
MHSRREYRAHSLLAVVIVLSCGAASALAQEAGATAEDPAHQELRKLRDEAVEAFKAKDIDRLLACLDEDVVVTLQNAEVCVGHEGVKAFHERMSEGSDRTVQSQETTFKVDDLSLIHGGDTAIARGSLDDHFMLTNGMEFDLHSRWSATAVKEDDRWLVASFHASANMFDNGVSDLMLKWNSLKVGGIALLAGVVGTAVVMRARKPRTQQAAA